MAEIFLPTLHTFAMNNIFTGSCGLLRFQVTPTVIKRQDNPKEVDMEQSSIKAEFWHGPFCYDKSEIEAEKTFPMSQEGRQEIIQWLLENI